MSKRSAGPGSPHRVPSSVALLKVLVKPRASANRVVGMKDGTLCVQVTAPPVEGEANRALIETLAESLGVARSRVVIVSGDRSKRKTVRIAGITQDQVRTRLHLT